jgi:tetratricopeptide (TPR) repeat protein
MAQTPLTSFDAANKLYEQGKYSEAAAAYQKLIQSGSASAAVYYNLGNSFFKHGELGRAISAFRHAQQLSPRDPDVRANLQFARNQRQGPSAIPGRWQGPLAKLSLNEWTVMTSSALWLIFLLLALGQWRPALKPAISGYLLTLGIITGLLCACLGLSAYQNLYQTNAIVIVRDASVHNGPFDESPNAFTVHDGAELTILDRKDQWLQVSAGSRRLGWIHADQVLSSHGM